MMTDKAVRLEEIVQRYKGQNMTRTLRAQIYREIVPLLDDLSEHIDKKQIIDNRDNKLHIVLKAKSPLGKLLIDMLGEGAEVFQ